MDIRFALLASLGALVLGSSTLDAQAYCSLRDPNRSILELYPETETFRSLVGTVDEDVREAVGEQLPFTLHFNELGRHTLYATVDERFHPVGLVHARSEPGRWGLVEVVWSLGLDLRVRDFRFQRCREKEKDYVESEAFRSLLAGRAVEDLLVLLTEDGSALRPDALPQVPEKARDLAAVVVRCALKTQVVTAIAWADELPDLRAPARASDSFDGFAETRALESLYGKEVLQRLAREDLPARATGIQRHSVRAWSVEDDEEQRLGTLFLVPWELEDQEVTLWVAVDDRGEILAVDPQDDWRAQDLCEAFASLVGASLAEPCVCASATGLVAQEIRILWEELAARG